MLTIIFLYFIYNFEDFTPENAPQTALSFVVYYYFLPENIFWNWQEKLGNTCRANKCLEIIAKSILFIELKWIKEFCLKQCWRHYMFMNIHLLYFLYIINSIEVLLFSINCCTCNNIYIKLQIGDLYMVIYRLNLGSLCIKSFSLL